MRLEYAVQKRAEFHGHYLDFYADLLEIVLNDVAICVRCALEALVRIVNSTGAPEGDISEPSFQVSRRSEGSLLLCRRTWAGLRTFIAPEFVRWSHMGEQRSSAPAIDKLDDGIAVDGE